MNEPMSILIGKKILKIYVNKDNDILAFDTSEGLFCFYSWGDCCSCSWFSDITSVEALLDSTVTDAKEVYIGNTNNEEDQFIQTYGIKITTTKGYADIVFRNESNGYYGGNIERASEKFLKDNNFNIQDAIEIKEDWNC